MEIFYSDNVCSDRLFLTPEDSVHCARVLRHRCGDRINVVDGRGTLYECTIMSDREKTISARVDSVTERWNSHPYSLILAVCPTKNNERFEWFVEKAVELGVDRIVPVIGQRSERKVYKKDRAVKIVAAASKQSLKAAFAEVSDPLPVLDFIKECSLRHPSALKMIACCFETETAPRKSIVELLSDVSSDGQEIVVMIGPEGDFSPLEAETAVAAGFSPVSLGESRLRSETAGVVAATLVYGAFIGK